MLQIERRAISDLCTRRYKITQPKSTQTLISMWIRFVQIFTVDCAVRETSALKNKQNFTESEVW